MYRLAVLTLMIVALLPFQGCANSRNDIAVSELIVSPVASGFRWRATTKVSNKSAAEIVVKSARITYPISLRLIEDSSRIVDLATPMHRSKTLSQTVQPGTESEIVLHLAMDPMTGSGARLQGEIVLVIQQNNSDKEVELNFRL